MFPSASFIKRPGQGNLLSILFLKGTANAIAIKEGRTGIFWPVELIRVCEGSWEPTWCHVWWSAPRNAAGLLNTSEAASARPENYETADDMLFFLSDGNTCSLCRTWKWRIMLGIFFFTQNKESLHFWFFFFFIESTLRVYITGFAAGGEVQSAPRGFFFFLFLLHSKSSQWEAVPLFFLGQNWGQWHVDPSKDEAVKSSMMTFRAVTAAPLQRQCVFGRLLVRPDWNVSIETPTRPADSFFFLSFLLHFFALEVDILAKVSQRPKGRDAGSLVWSVRVDAVVCMSEWGLFAFHTFTRAWRWGIRRYSSGLVGHILQPQHQLSSSPFQRNLQASRSQVRARSTKGLITGDSVCACTCQQSSSMTLLPTAHVNRF